MIRDNSRTKKSAKNAMYAVLLQICTTLISLVTRTALIKTLGIEAVSLNSLFTEVISMLSLTELGVGTAIVYNLYKPLAEENYEKIRQLINLFKKAYRIIAFVTFGLGLALVPWITYLVNDIGYSDNYIRLVFMLFVVQTASSYLFSYKTSLLNADQKKYIVSIITVLVRGLGTAGLIAILMLTHNYVAYLSAYVVVNFMINVVASLYVDKNYPYLKEDKKAKLPKNEQKDVLSNVGNLFIRTISHRITNSTDNMLISVLVSTIQVGFYSNYSVILNIMKQLSTQIISGITGSLGNLMATESSDQCDRVLRRLTYLFFSTGLVLTLGFYGCLSSVIKLWIGEEYLLPNYLVGICCIVMFFEFVTRPLWEILTVSGMFKKDKNISIIGSTINLIVSIALGSIIGMAGIFIGTICTYLIQVILKIRLLYRGRFGFSPIRYYLFWAKMIALMLFCMVVMSFIMQFILISNPIISILCYGTFAVILGMFTAILFFFRTEEYRYAKNMIIKFINR